MKKACAWLLVFLLVICGSFGAGRLYRNRKIVQKNAKPVEQDSGFRPSEYPIVNHAFVIFICGYNNGAFLEKTLRSVFSQAYENYRLIYIDDGSTDGSFYLAQECISQSGHAARVAIAHNDQKLGIAANLVRAVRSCKDHEIVVILNGQDWLAHEWALQQLNQYYADPDLWLSYAQYIEFPSYHKGTSRLYLQSEWGDFRQAPLVADHLPSFYAALFKRVQESDLLYDGKYISESCEFAMMLPMLEMAKGHFQFIPSVLSVSNQNAYDREHHDSQMQYERYIRSLKPYSPLLTLPIELESKEAGT